MLNGSRTLLFLVLAMGVAACASLRAQEDEIVLDFREANVVQVEFEVQEDGTIRFDVTLHHDDDGESPSYADWWQVEDAEGNVLGKRVLLHAHSSEPFTRSEIVSIPEGIETVIIRGHDMVHGFGGQAAELRLQDGRIDFIQDLED
jgi:hypothetical protein